jgi:hypothetical protein
VHTFVGVDLFLHGHFIGRAGLEAAADADVHALRVLAKDDEVDVLPAAVFQRRETIVDQADRAEVDVEIERKARAEQDVAGRAVIGHARVAKRAEQDCAELVAQHVVPVRRNGDACREEMVGAPGQRLEVECLAGNVTHGLEDLDRFGRDFLPDAITR